MKEYAILFLVLLFLVSFLYASVGHGGASGYLALMGIWGVEQSVSKPIALLLNCAVSLIAFIAFYRKGFFNKSMFLGLAVASIPAAYLGSLISLQDHIYKTILGVLLCIAASRLVLIPKEVESQKQAPLWALLLLGGSIGLVSGMIGIGGGIILSPILILFTWSSVKETSGISALFIFVNSVAGLIGLYQKGIAMTTEMKYMLLVALIGGLFGSYIGAGKMPVHGLKKLLALGLIIASFKLFFL